MSSHKPLSVKKGLDNGDSLKFSNEMLPKKTNLYF